MKDGLLDQKTIDGLALLRNQSNLTSLQYQASGNLFESITRLIRRREELMNVANIKKPSYWAMYPNWIDDMAIAPSKEEQAAIYDKNEALFQGYYNTLSSLAAFQHLLPYIFGNIPVRSMSKFIKSLIGRFPELTTDLNKIEAARSYRAFLDHPAGSQTFDWWTTTPGDERGVIIVHFGKKGLTGNIPDIATTGKYGIIQLPGDWYISPPNYLEVEISLKNILDHTFNYLRSNNQ